MQRVSQWTYIQPYRARQQKTHRHASTALSLVSYMDFTILTWSQTGQVSLRSIHSSMQQRWKWCSHLVIERGFSSSYSGERTKKKGYYKEILWSSKTYSLDLEHPLVHQWRIMGVSHASATRNYSMMEVPSLLLIKKVHYVRLHASSNKWTV